MTSVTIKSHSDNFSGSMRSVVDIHNTTVIVLYVWFTEPLPVLAFITNL